MRKTTSHVLARLLSFLHQHTVLALGILFLVGMLLIIANLYGVAQKINEDAASTYAAVFVRSLDKFRVLYNTDVVSRIQPLGIQVLPDYANHPGAIPIPSTLGIEVSEQISEPGSGIKARLYSDLPYPNRPDGGPHTDFEKEALARLRAAQDKSLPYSRFANVNGRLSLQYGQAVLMAQACVTCHNADLNSPKRDWQVGEVGGVQEVILPVDSAVGTVRRGLLTTLGVMVTITLAGLGLLALTLGALRSSILMLQRTNAAYTRFVPQEFLSLLGKQSILDVALADNVQMKMTVLFSDIRSFTTISEGMEPEKNFQFLSEFLSAMGPVIRDHHGFIDKYIGDAIMAVFNTADDAVAAALALKHELAEFNRKRVAQRLEPIDIGIGLNTGRLMLGTLGEMGRMDGTVISDAVNVASRIEDLTKLYKASLIISQSTYDGLANANRLAVRLLDHVRLRGKAEPITIYEVFSGDPPDVKARKQVTKREFEHGIQLYQAKLFRQARAEFEQCLVADPDDRPAQFYVERCDSLLQTGVGKDWDGVMNLDSK